MSGFKRRWSSNRVALLCGPCVLVGAVFCFTGGCSSFSASDPSSSPDVPSPDAASLGDSGTEAAASEADAPGTDATGPDAGGPCGDLPLLFSDDFSRASSDLGGSIWSSVDSPTNGDFLSFVADGGLKIDVPASADADAGAKQFMRKNLQGAATYCVLLKQVQINANAFGGGDNDYLDVFELHPLLDQEYGLSLVLAGSTPQLTFRNNDSDQQTLPFDNGVAADIVVRLDTAMQVATGSRNGVTVSLGFNHGGAAAVSARVNLGASASGIFGEELLIVKGFELHGK